MKDRKKDHLELALAARIGKEELDRRFYFEPLLSKHPTTISEPFEFLGKKMNAPLWISSMTGGTNEAFTINKNLAKACREFGLGMGLGSCRKLLENNDDIKDFDLRKIIGEELPFYANLGIAQVEEMVLNDDVTPIEKLVSRLRADGLIIHVNPIQEWIQPEGNRLTQPPIDTIKSLIEMTQLRVIVKEVGQGMGPQSLRELLELPLEAIEFGAFGGTNFVKLESIRDRVNKKLYFDSLSRTGHDAFEMTDYVNDIIDEGISVQCKQAIISGGIRSFLDGYYLTERCKMPAIYGQASELLGYARHSYQELRNYIRAQIEGFNLARAYLKVK